MRIIVIGAVAAGTSAAAKARRNSENAEIVIYEKGEYVSYSGCGMAYHIGGEIKDGATLHPRDDKYFKEVYNVDIKIKHEVSKINPSNQSVEVKNLSTGETFIDNYDKLIIATGARAIKPPIEGVDLEHVFLLRNINNMYAITNYLNKNKVKNAVVVGGGFIGLEVSEALRFKGINVSLVEFKPQVATSIDADIAKIVELELTNNGVDVHKGVAAQSITNKKVQLSNGKELLADIVIIAVGVRPNSEIAQEAGVKLGNYRGILVNEKLETNIPNIYAAGDVSEQYHNVIEDYVYIPLGSTANRQGRAAGDQATGGEITFGGIIGTSIYRIFSLTVAQTGINEEQAKNAGFDPVVLYNIKADRPEYFGGKDMYVKAVADQKSKRLLGAQIVGPNAVDRTVNTFAAVIHLKGTVDDLVDLDLAYAPPYANPRDIVNYTGMMYDNVIRREKKMMRGKEVKKKIVNGEPLIVIDTRSASAFAASHVPGALNIPLSQLREKAASLPKHLPIVFYCNRGLDGYVGQTILENLGFQHVYNIRGGYFGYLLDE